MNENLTLLKQKAGIDYNPDQEGLDLFAELIVEEFTTILKESASAYDKRALFNPTEITNQSIELIKKYLGISK
jgi:hypothetical protein